MKSILIVDDESDIRDLLKFEFELAGWRVYEAENGKIGAQVFQDKKPDAVITDMRMPGGDGVYLLERVMEISPKTPVLIATGFADISHDEAIKKGALALVAKPFDLQTVFNMVSTAVK